MLTINPQSSIGSTQLIQLYLEQLLIYLHRRYCEFPIQSSSITVKNPDKTITEAFQRIVEYLNCNLAAHMTIEKICRDNLIGRSQLQKIFHKKTNLGIIEYFLTMKIDAAKEMIRTGNLNFTQISEELSYTSIHYFSRHFKKLTRMTPSEYASSIKAIADGEL